MGSLAASIGWWVFTLGQGWLVLELTNSPFLVGLSFFAANGPVLAFSLIGGVLADRVKRQRLLVVTRALGSLLMLSLALLVISDRIQTWHVFLIAFFMGSTLAMDQPTVQALIPSLIEKEELMNAVALNSAAMSSTRLLGPILATPLVALMGLGPNFLLAATAYAASSAIIGHLRAPTRASSGGGVVENIRQGFSYLAGQPAIYWVIALVAGHCLFTMSYLALLPVMARDVLQVGPAQYGMLMMADGAGGMMGTLGIASLSSFSRKRALLVALGLLSGLALLFFGLSPVLFLSLVAMAMLGAAGFAFMAMATTLVVGATVDQVRGRVMSIYLIFSRGMMSVGTLALGGMASLWSGPVALGVAAAIWLAMAILFRGRVLSSSPSLSVEPAVGSQ